MSAEDGYGVNSYSSITYRECQSVLDHLNERPVINDLLIENDVERVRLIRSLFQVSFASI